MPTKPSRLGPYALGDVAHRRGLTVTYRASHEALGRPALVKTLDASVLLPSPFADELDREARLLAGLSHESVARLLEAGREAGAPWLAFEDAGGVWLTELCARTPRLAVDAALAIALAVASGLVHAHAKGALHLELSAAQVQVTPEGGVKLWGFAPWRGRDLDDRAPPIEAGRGSVEPGSLAPEQILGEPLGPQADVFALGALLYEMLAGERPFASKDGRETRQRIRTAAPAPLPAEVPRAVDRIVTRCLEKRPEDRFESARALETALEALLVQRTREASRLLVQRALAAAKLGPDPKVARAPRLARAEAAYLPALRRNAVIFALIVAGGGALALVGREGDGEGAPPSAAQGASADSVGYLRVLATPWADVIVDGELVDTTPVGKPIAVSPGRHFVTFRHPNAPDEKREVTVSRGQTVLLDVSMTLEKRGSLDAGVEAGVVVDDP